LAASQIEMLSQSGTGIMTIVPPATNTNRTLTLPDSTTTVVGTDATQTLTNKTIQGGALTLATAVASTSGTSVDFTSIPSWVKRITVMLGGVSTNGTSDVLIRLGDSGGIEDTNYNSSAASNTTAGVASAKTSTAGFLTAPSQSLGTTNHGQAIISLQDATTNTWVSSFNCMFSNSGTCGFGGGSKALSATLDRVRVTTANGTDTFDAGTINIMYEG